MKLRLRGFIGIKSGPDLLMDGPDEAVIDFDGREGISTFEGQNGCGKSTLIESLHHYPRFLSRGTKLWANCYTRDAEKEFESDFMGHHYRSLVKIDAQTHKMEGFLFIDGSPTSCCPTSISAFEDKVTEIFGKWETFKRAQFSPQRSRETSGDQIENMTPGDFRDILREYLNLQLWDTRSKAAKGMAEIIEGQAAGFEGRMAAIKSTMDSAEATRFNLSGATQAEAAGNESLAGLKGLLIVNREAVDTLKATIQANALALQRKTDLQGQIDRLTVELEKEKTAAEGEIAKLTTRWKELKAELTKVDGVLAGREVIEKAAGEVKGLEDRAVELQVKMDKINEELPGHQQAVHELETQIAGLRQQAKDLENDPEIAYLNKKSTDLNKDIAASEAKIKEYENDPYIARLEAGIAALETAAKVGDGIKEDCKETTCGAIAAVLAAKEKLPVEREALKQRQTAITNSLTMERAVLLTRQHSLSEAAGAWRDRQEKIAALRADFDTQIRTLTHDLKNAQQSYQSLAEMLTRNKNDLFQARQEIFKQKSLADRLPEITVAEQRKGDLEKQLQEVTEQGTVKREAWEAKEKDLGGRIFAQNSLLKSITVDDTAELSLSQTQTEITDLETVKIPAIEREIQAAREKVATLKAELTRIEEAEKELQQVREEKETLTAEVARWRYLQNFCGEKGYQAVAVSAATPRIIKYANDLLTTAFDVPYTVRLKTQDDQGKEIFKVVILCPDGREVDLDAISGGQRSWAIPPLLLGMSLLSREESGREFDYFCVDEIDGAMSDENKVKCANFYPAFFKLAKLKYLPFITHCEAARNVADHRLVFEAGKSPSWQ